MSSLQQAFVAYAASLDLPCTQLRDWPGCIRGVRGFGTYVVTCKCGVKFSRSSLERTTAYTSGMRQDFLRLLSRVGDSGIDGLGPNIRLVRTLTGAWQPANDWSRCLLTAAMRNGDQYKLKRWTVARRGEWHPAAAVRHVASPNHREVCQHAHHFRETIIAMQL